MDMCEVREFLHVCERRELRDHAFGDTEVFWSVNGKQVATGYFGGGRDAVWLDDGTLVEGSDARDLEDLGNLKTVNRNDQIGPHNYKKGVVMQSLTKEALMRELTETTR